MLLGKKMEQSLPGPIVLREMGAMYLFILLLFGFVIVGVHATYSRFAYAAIAPENAEKNLVDTDRGNGVAGTEQLQNLVRRRVDIARKGEDLKKTSITALAFCIALGLFLIVSFIYNHGLQTDPVTGGPAVNWYQPVRRTWGYGMLTMTLVGIAVLLGVHGGMSYEYADALMNVRNCGTNPRCEIPFLKEMHQRQQDLHHATIGISVLTTLMFIYQLADLAIPITFQENPHTVVGGFKSE